MTQETRRAIVGRSRRANSHTGRRRQIQHSTAGDIARGAVCAAAVRARRACAVARRAACVRIQRVVANIACRLARRPLKDIAGHTRRALRGLRTKAGSTFRRARPAFAVAGACARFCQVHPRVAGRAVRNARAVAGCTPDVAALADDVCACL